MSVRLADLRVGDRIVKHGRSATVVCAPVRIVTHGSHNAQAVIEYDRPSHWSHYDTVSGTDDTEYEQAEARSAA